MVCVVAVFSFLPFVPNDVLYMIEKSVKKNFTVFD